MALALTPTVTFAGANSCDDLSGVYFTHVADSLSQDQRQQILDIVNETLSSAASMARPAEIRLALAKRLVIDYQPNACGSTIQLGFKYFWKNPPRDQTPVQQAQYRRFITAHEVGHLILDANLARDVPGYGEVLDGLSQVGKKLGKEKNQDYLRRQVKLERRLADLQDSVGKGAKKKIANIDAELRDIEEARLALESALGEAALGDVPLARRALNEPIFGGLQELFADVVGLMVLGDKVTIDQIFNDDGRSFNANPAPGIWIDGEAHGLYGPTRGLVGQYYRADMAPDQKSAFVAATYSAILGEYKAALAKNVDLRTPAAMNRALQTRLEQAYQAAGFFPATAR